MKYEIMIFFTFIFGIFNKMPDPHTEVVYEFSIRATKFQISNPHATPISPSITIYAINTEHYFFCLLLYRAAW